MTRAYEMAVDALGLALTSREGENQPFPVSSDPTKIIPEWMNEAAMAMDLNFSQILQEALLKKIQM